MGCPKLTERDFIRLLEVEGSTDVPSKRRTRPSVNVVYTYDDAGNRLTKSVDSVTGQIVSRDKLNNLLLEGYKQYYAAYVGGRMK